MRVAEVEEAITKIKTEVDQLFENKEAKSVRALRLSQSLSGHVHAKAPTFDGSTPWATYCWQFEAAAWTYQWSKVDKVISLILALRGTAAELLQKMPADNQIVKALELWYSDQQMHKVYQVKSQQQRLEDNLQEFEADVDWLVRLAYPKARCLRSWATTTIKNGMSQE